MDLEQTLKALGVNFERSKIVLNGLFVAPFLVQGPEGQQIVMYGSGLRSTSRLPPYAVNGAIAAQDRALHNMGYTVMNVLSMHWKELCKAELQKEWMMQQLQCVGCG
jgi:hypothetical protein